MKKKFITLVCFITLFFCKINIVAAQINLQDSLALVDLYNSTDGPHWKDNTNWLTSAPVSTWAGIELVNNNNRVVKIFLDSKNLNGTIPSSIGNLTALNTLRLSSNNLSGNIPSSLGNLTALEVLYLYENSLSGNIPSSLGNLYKLTNLILNNNYLSGSIPSSFKNLGKLSTLSLEENNLSGSIPLFLGTLYNLYSLTLSKNQLTGSIPSSLANLNKLIDLRLDNNMLTGSIPPELGNLKAIVYLFLDHNKLSGKIPVNFRNIPAYDIIINNNNFTFAGMERAAQKFLRTTGYFYYYQQGNINLHKTGNTIYVSAGGELAHNTYRWFKNGELYAKKRGDSTLTINSNGEYYVSVTNFNATQLTLSSDTIKYVSGNNAIASQLDNKTSSISVYPNPAKSNTTLSFTATGKYSITIVDVKGKTLQTTTGISNKAQNIIQLNVSNYASGMYLIIITDEKNNKQVVKLNKE